MTPHRAPSRSTINTRARDIGHEIFERAASAQPSLWNKAWWAERPIRWLDRDEVLRTRAFQFVDCLPALTTSESLVRHLREYLDPRYVELPRWANALLQPGFSYVWRREWIAAAVRFGASRMAERFIAGYDLPSLRGTLLHLRRRGMNATLDVLGEFTTSEVSARKYADAYEHLMERLAAEVRGWTALPLLDRDARGPMPRLNLSIKLTGLAPHVDVMDPAAAVAAVSVRLRLLLRRARDAGAFVNIDMESSRYRPITFELFKTLLMEDEFRDWSDVGIVVQAYLRSGETDLAELLDWGRRRGTRFAIRLVKGAYWDAETAAAIRQYAQPPVWTQKWESDACFERMTRTLLENAALVRPAFASHNVRSLAHALAVAEAFRLTPHDYEVQMLYGMGDPLKAALVGMGQSLRVYCPYGDLMPGMGYLIRRLLENTSNDSFLKQGFDRRAEYDRLLADPAEARPFSTPPPDRHYRNSNPEEPMGTFTNAAVTSFSSPDNVKKMIGALAYVRGELGRSYPLVINGEPALTESWSVSHNPSHRHEIVGRVALATTTDAERAVAAARRAFTDWRHTPAAHRADLLRKIADRIEMRRFELAAAIILEVGKPWREADADVVEAIDHLRYYAEQIQRIESRPRLRNLPGENNMLTYSPKGVCAVIAPWSFPLAILTGMTSAALAAGNTVVMKPARQASVVAARLVDIMQQAGIPRGVVNYLPGEGAVVGRHLVEHADVNIVAFTGSLDVGAEVISSGALVRPGQFFIKKMIVEMGGKNAILVDDDADLDAAVQGVLESAFGYAGQKCSSCSRLIVVGEVYDALAARLVDAVRSLPIGPAEQPGALVGPVIDEEHRRRILSYLEIGRSEGRLLVQAELPPSCAEGFFVPPTIIADVKPDARVAQEEVFGPLLAMIPAADFDDALHIANHSRYALTGGLYSRSPAHIEQARREFLVGNLYINRRITGSQVDAQPFGGCKLSGTGVKAGSPDYLLHFMDARCITENTLRSGLVPQEKPTEIHG